MDPISTTRAVSDLPTPANTRDLVLDLLRAGALGVVVVWHWVFTTIRWTSDGPHVGNPVAGTPGLWLLTWFLQVMPAFFMIGGGLHLVDRAPARQFWAKRIRRLVIPVLPLLSAAAVALAAAAAAGRHDLVRGVLLVISPMWFLATYLVCIAVAPAARLLHRRFGPGVVLVGVIAALGVDWLRIGLGIGGPLTGLLAFVLVWSTVHQLGFQLTALRAATRSTQIGTAVLGYGLLAFAAWRFTYPAAMVGLDGHELSNMGPPTTMVIFLAIGQLGLISLLGGVLERFALSHRTVLAAAGEWSMTVYAWHLCAFALFWAGLVRVGVDVGSRVDSGWWLQRPLWVIGPLILAIPICRFTRRFDRTNRRYT